MLLISLSLLVSLVSSTFSVTNLSQAVPKHIMFASSGGGSSHHMWVLELLEEMHKRGHSVSMYSREDQLRFSKEYPMVKTKAIGGDQDFLLHPIVLDSLANHVSNAELRLNIAESVLSNYTQEYKEYMRLYKSEKIHLAICDGISIACTDSAMASKVPVIMTSTFLNNAASFPSASNTAINFNAFLETDASIFERLYMKFIISRKFMRSVSKNLKQVLDFQLQSGSPIALDSSAAKYTHIPKLINNMFGVEHSIQLPPNIHMAGPIMRKSYEKLENGATKAFLDDRKRVAYIAFGQHATLSTKDIAFIMQGLLKLLENGDIDGILWARIKYSQLPSEIKTPQHVYSQQELMSHPCIHLNDWAPQFSILQHPATIFFISHGGAGSLHEAVYSAVRLLVFPVFGDQPRNARSIQRSGLGLFYQAQNDDTFDDQSFFESLYRVAVDPGRAIQNRVDKYSAFVQISTKNAVSNGANILEESLYASDENGRLPHRIDIEHDFISWLKKYDFDLYLIIGSVSLLLLTVGLNTLEKV